MKTPGFVQRLSRGRALAASCIVGGVGFLLGSLRFQSVRQFLPATFIEVGAALLLLGPLLFLQRRIQDEVGVVKEQLEDTRADLAQAEAKLDALTPSEELSEAVTRRLASNRADDEQLFASIARAPSLDAVDGALRRAAEIGVVSKRMPRVTLFDTNYVLRFLPADDGDVGHPSNAVAPLRVNVEQQGGKVVHEIDWTDEMTAVDLGEAIGKWLIARDRYPGDIAFQPGQAFTDLAALLRRAHMRVTGARGITVDLKPVLQLFGDEIGGDYWWITDAGLQRDGTTFTYTIAKTRFGELDWDRHVTSREGVDSAAFRQALDTATALLARKML